MAPSRRRGVAKTSSAAARRQWKVGDLVLAKVKGFPAWPATVSEPEKWGYSTDWKKVLVYFFGTKQIAFCNPADVEAFTEEKKKSLLAKRQGKGADFVRAVQEIIDCYESSQVHEQDDEGSSGHEDDVSNAGYSEGSDEKVSDKFEVQSPVAARNSVSESLFASSHHHLEVSARLEMADIHVIGRSSEHRFENAQSFDRLKEKATDTNISIRKRPGEIQSVVRQKRVPRSRSTSKADLASQHRLEVFAATELADSHDMEKTSAVPLDLLRESTLVATNSLKERSGDTLLQSFARKNRVCRSRSTSKADPSRLLTHILPLTDNNTGIGELLSNIIPQEYTARNKRTRKSPDISVWHGTVSPSYSAAFVSCGSCEDDDSVVVTNSDTVSFNECSTLESSCKSAGTDLVVDNLEKDVQLSDRLHFQDETVVLKKKRKPNRKRTAHDVIVPISSPKKERCLETHASKVTLSSPYSCEKVQEQTSRADGDEHLPLVKRARVRMGKLPEERNQLTDLEGREEKSSQDVLINNFQQVSSSSGCVNNFHNNEITLEVKDAVIGSSSPNCSNHTEDGPLFRKAVVLINNSQQVSSSSGCVNNSHNSEIALEMKDAVTGFSPLNCSNHTENGPLFWKAKKSSEDVLINNSQQVSSSSGCVNNSHNSAIALEVKDAVIGSSPLNCSNHSENGSLFWKAKKYQLHGSVDGEAALPPSKRLHRALEAMSANAVEDGQAYAEPNGTTVKFTSGCSDSSERSLSHTSVGDKVNIIPDMEDVNSLGDNKACMNNAIRLSPGVTSPSADKEAVASLAMEPSDHLVEFSVSSESDDVDKVVVNPTNLVDVKNIAASCDSISDDQAETKSEGLECLSNFEGKQEVNESPVGSLDQVSPADKEKKYGILGRCNGATEKALKVECAYSPVEKSAQEHCAERPDQERLDSFSEAKDACTRDALLSFSQGDRSKSLQFPMPPPEEHIKDMRGAVDEVKGKLAHKDIDAPVYSSSMQVLIAAAQAKRNLSRATSLSDNVMVDKIVYDAVSTPSLGRRVDSYVKTSPLNSTVFHVSAAENRNCLLHNGGGSPDILKQSKKNSQTELDGGGNSGSSFSHKKSSGRCTTAEANAARKSFEFMLGTLTRTKECIGRATRLAIDCAKCGIGSEVLDILVRCLEGEASLHRRVDLFFLVDSITQCSRSQKGDVGAIYPSLVQAMLPRLLSAAAPPGHAARENRKQCLKVLRLWLERKTLPESIIRHHVRELDSLTDTSYSSARSRRPSRMERAMNDPIREMEGMHVDEYGSNASFHLPGFCMPRMLEDDEGSDADGKSFEAVTPERDPEVPNEQETAPTSVIVKHCHILEDVDGELEMEDVAPSYEAHVGVNPIPAPHCHIEQPTALPFAPPLPEDNPPSPPPLPVSPPPLPPPLPSTAVIPTASAMGHPITECADSNLYTSNHQGPPSVNSMMLDITQNYALGYRDLGKQAPRPTLSSSSGASCGFPIPQQAIQASNTVQHVDRASLRGQNYPVQPPPPTLSNQFSYVQGDQRRQSWTDPSSYLTKRIPYGHDLHRDIRYDSGERMEHAPYEIGERCKIAAPVHPGPLHSDNPDTFNVPVSHYGPRNDSQVLNHSWSFPPRAISYRHPTPSRPPECTIAGANGGPNFWIPR